jgi:hypothetical protein
MMLIETRADVDQQIAAWQAQHTGPAVPSLRCCVIATPAPLAGWRCATRTPPAT